MTPNVDDRIGSIIRALTDVILPALPPEAGLAQEQVQLSIGHLQILRMQLDEIPGFEADELADAQELGKALVARFGGEPAVGALQTALTAPAENVRAARLAISQATDGLIAAIYSGGDTASQAALRDMVLEHERPRVLKDRKWFLPFGFDTL